MRIQAIEQIKDGRREYQAGDIVTVSDEDGAYFVGNGWAKDLDEQLPTGERNTQRRVLDVRGANQSATAEAV